MNSSPVRIHTGGRGSINTVVTCSDSEDIVDDETFGLALENEVELSRVGVSNSTAKPRIYYLTLGEKLDISSYTANKTLQVDRIQG